MDIYKLFYVELYMAVFSSVVWIFILVLEKIIKYEIDYRVKIWCFIFTLVPFCSNKVQIFDPEVIWIEKYKLVSIGWTIGVCFLLTLNLIYELYSSWQTLNFKYCSDARVKRIYKKCTDELNYDKPSLVESENVSIAAATGIIHRFIICNIKNINKYTDEEIKFILLHELLHHKQKHLLYMKVSKYLGIVYWFNPIFVFIRKNFLLCCEYECDNKIVNNIAIKDVSKYMNLLLQISCKEKRQYCQITSQVKRRILNLSKKKSKLKNNIILLLCILGLTLIIFKSITYSEKYFYPYPGLVNSVERAE